MRTAMYVQMEEYWLKLSSASNNITPRMDLNVHDISTALSFRKIQEVLIHCYIRFVYT